MWPPMGITCQAFPACSRPAICGAGNRWWCGRLPRDGRRRKESIATSGGDYLQPGVFRFSLDEDRDVGVGVFPEAEEILVGGLCLGLIARHSERSAQLQVRQRADGIADYNAAVIENFLEFRGGFGALVCGQIGLAAQIDRIERPEETMNAAAGRAHFVRSGDLKQFDSLCGLAMVKGESCPKRRKVIQSD